MIYDVGFCQLQGNPDKEHIMCGGSLAFACGFLYDIVIIESDCLRFEISSGQIYERLFNFKWR